MKLQKSLLSSFLVCVLASMLLCPLNIQANDDILSQRVEVSNFSFTDQNDVPIQSLSDGITVKASCTICRTESGSGAQSYVFLLMARKNGRLISISTEKGSVSIADGNKNISVQTTISSSNGITITAFLWNSLQEGIPLASPATFASSESGLRSILIDGIPLSNFQSSSTTYAYEFPIGYTGKPDIRGVPKDLGSKINVQAKSSFPQTATIEVLSHDKSQSTTYSILLTVAQPEKKTMRIYPTVVNQVKGLVSWELGWTALPSILLMKQMQFDIGGTRMGYLKFDLSSLPENASIQNVSLNFKASETRALTAGETISQTSTPVPDYAQPVEVAAFFVEDDNWDTNYRSGISSKNYPAHKEYPFSNSVVIPTKTTTTYDWYSIDLDSFVIEEQQRNDNTLSFTLKIISTPVIWENNQYEYGNVTNVKINAVNEQMYLNVDYTDEGTVVPKSTETRNAIGDAYISSSAAALNYGTSEVLHIRKEEGGNTAAGIFLFDLTGLTAESTREAQLVFHIQANGTIKDFTGYVYEMEGGWDENTVTWTNAPNPGMKIASFTMRALSDIVSRNVVCMDVSEYLIQALEDGKESIGFWVCFDQEEVAAISEGNADVVAAKIISKELASKETTEYSDPYRKYHSPTLIIKKQ